MKATKSGRFKVNAVTVTEKGVSYETFRITGWLDGRRVRKQFKNRDEALGEKLRLEVRAANTGEIAERFTRLSVEQLAEAEAAFAALGGQSLGMAVQWFKDNYRPPAVAKPLEEATAEFLIDRARHVRPVVLRTYRHTMTALVAAFPGRHAHDVSTAEVQGFLERRQIGKKRFNNLRGDLHAFFTYCALRPPRWVVENPVTPIQSFRIARGIPEIISAARCAEIMAHVEICAGGPRSNLPAGCLVPYFALALFAGLRPSVGNGEIAKLATTANLSRTIDLGLGVIRLSPEQSKVKGVRQVTIQPNLAAWLTRFPVDRFPILPPNARRMINQVRHKFGIGPDVMRHTFVSMLIAKFKSLGDAALQAGNSETMIRRHYLNLVSEVDAEAFWSIGPT